MTGKGLPSRRATDAVVVAILYATVFAGSFAYLRGAIDDGAGFPGFQSGAAAALLAITPMALAVVLAVSGVRFAAEYRRKAWGYRLRLRLMASFVAVAAMATIPPTLFLGSLTIEAVGSPSSLAVREALRDGLDLALTYYAEKAGIAPENMRVVSIMPCTAKKGEAKRKGMDSASLWWEGKGGTKARGKGTARYQDVDWALTTRELARMIRLSGIDMAALPEEEFDSPLGASTGAATIFGTTGGVMEAALRTVYEILEGKPLPQTDFTPVRGLQGIKTAEVPVAGMKVRVAVVHGLKNARVLLDEMAAGKSTYHFIEVMSCPGGCIGGGGQPVLPDMEKKLARNRSLYAEDLRLPERKSHQNIEVSALYKEFLGKPAGHLSHELLHTHYAEKTF